MKIKFLKPDPRAGSVVQLDSNLAHRFIAEGCAEQVSERPEAKAEPAAPANKAEPRAPSNKAAKAAKAGK